MTLSTSSEKEILFIGQVTPHILEGKLPTNKQLLSVFFYSLNSKKLSYRECARIAVKEAIIYWEKAEIPTRHEQHCIQKLETLYEEWATLRKNRNRNSQKQRKKETEFKNKMPNVFDISHATALNSMKSPEDKQFFLNQLNEGRVASLTEIDKKALQKQQRLKDRIKKENERKRKYEEQKCRGNCHFFWPFFN